MAEKAHLRLRMGLFEAECQTINALIMNHAQNLKNCITKHVAKQLIDREQQLVISYEDGSKILLKKPETAQELVELPDYIDKFEAEELAEFEDVSHVLGRQLSFLFETDHSLSHDLLRTQSAPVKRRRAKPTAKAKRITQRTTPALEDAGKFIRSCQMDKKSISKLTRYRYMLGNHNGVQVDYGSNVRKRAKRSVALLDTEENSIARCSEPKHRASR